MSDMNAIAVVYVALVSFPIIAIGTFFSIWFSWPAIIVAIIVIAFILFKMFGPW